MKPHGRALLDYLNGETGTKILLWREDGETMDVPAALFFRDLAEFSALERKALDVCRGRVLDVGAGAGSHCLELQARGFSVCALDFLPEAIDVMRKRGVRDVYCAPVADFQAEPFDTFLMLMNGIGIVETLDGFRCFLDDARRLLNPDGQIVFDGADLRRDAEPVDRAYQEANRRAGRFWGEYRYHLRYRREAGPPFAALFIDPETLTTKANEAGWKCEILLEGEAGAYVARLTQA